MFKLIATVALVGLLAACSSMPGPMSGSAGSSGTATMGASSMGGMYNPSRGSGGPN